MAPEFESGLQDTVDWGRKWHFSFNAGKTQLVSFDQSNNVFAIDVKLDGSVSEEKSSFKILGLSFSSKLDWDSYITLLLNLTPRKFGTLICFVKFPSPEITLDSYKSIIRLYMEYSYDFTRNTVFIFGLVLLSAT